MYQRAVTLSVLLLLSVLLSPGCARHTTALPEAREAPEGRHEAQKIVVATVNEAPIMMDAVIRMMNRMKIPNHGELPEEYRNEVRNAAVQRLILQELAYQQAKTAGITVEQKSIDQVIADFKEKMGGEKQAAEYLAKEGLAQVDLNAQVERSLMLEQIYAKEVAAKASVSEEDLQAAYDKDKAAFVMPEKVRITDVIVFIKEDGKKARQKARDLRTRIMGDTDQDPWKLVLDGTFLVRNLDLRKGQTRNHTLYLAAKTMKNSAVSDVIEDDEGVHIVKLLEFSPEKQLTLEEARPGIEARLRSAAQQKRVDAWFQELKKDARVEIKDPSFALSEASDAAAGETKK